MTASNFSSLNLSQAIIDNLNKLAYHKMTMVQAKSLPPILNNQDVIVQAKTGSGKTAAFGIALVTRLQIKNYEVQALVLCPTRELVDQVTKELRRLAQYTQNIKIVSLYGGVAYGSQMKSLSHPAHIVVGTPGRVLKHLSKGNLNLSSLNTLVLDEADRMLDMGFIKEIEDTLEFVPHKRQTMLFSATYTPEIKQLSLAIQNSAIEIKTVGEEKENDVTQYFYQVENGKQFEGLVKVISHFDPENIIVFTNTKIEAKEICRELNNNNIHAVAIHGDLEQYQRNDALVKFSSLSVPVLVATDVAARGLDIKDLKMVINYGIPFESNTYTHRIGRTARAGKKGLAATLYWGKQAYKAEKMQNNSNKFAAIKDLSPKKHYQLKSPNAIIVIEAGKRNKIRAGDILGALTGDVGLPGSSIGKISIYDQQSYVAIEKGLINKAKQDLKKYGIKGKKSAIWIMK